MRPWGPRMGNTGTDGVRAMGLGARRSSIVSAARTGRGSSGNRPVAVVLILGIAISAAVFLTTYRHQEDERIQHIFAEQAAPVSALVARALDRYLETVRSIGALYAASNAVDREGFRGFVARSLTRMPGIQAMEWIPRVPAAERADYEASARRDGFTDFRIKERNAVGKMVPAAARNEYFPVIFVEPLRGNERAVGFDLASNPARRAALDEARDSGEMVGTQRITLVPEEASQFGFLVFLPVYEKGIVPATVEQRRAKLKGFALGVYRIGDILDAAMEAAGRLVDLDLYFFDRSAAPGKRLLHHQRAAQNPVDAPNLAEEKVLSGLHQATSVTVAGRDWQLVFKPIASQGFDHVAALPLSAAAAILLLTLLLVQFLRAARSRAIEVEQLVDDRTDQLRASLPGRVLATAKPSWIADLTRAPDFLRAPLAREHGLAAAFAFPVMAGPNVVAVLEF